ncbi:ornithine cyclodeaminase family protein [Herbiconiux sp. VKM Ac-2851]|uniref:ornithine cyclodeaminase family protein n=1 Tax=Herbiconiux sp. VKM Ac-2851 TaxID=2739025 RepID=UPI00156354C2|nr:ornithine cyclodeaminase family protein [Herbiconiux sp. VKM Ac-2851]NQX35695.1 ornithine cyclodeaminase family protein [Herbiconiux sp. VKM Ac-2851]
MTIVLAAGQIADLVGGVDVYAAVEAIFADLGTGAMTQPAPIALAGADDAVFLPMAARSDRLGLVAVKLMADIPSNASRGLPSQRSTIVVSSVSTGECVAVLDGGIITRLRTAATSAVATRYLARPDSRVLGLIGAGNLALEHVRAIRRIAPIGEIVVWSRSTATLDRFQDALGGQFGALTVATGPQEVIERADIVCTLTPSMEPIVRGDWLRPGQHVNAVGARPRAGHRELDGAAMARGLLVVDSAATARAKSGDLVQAIVDGALVDDMVLRELGDIVARTAPGRTGHDEITVFDSVGLAAQDLAVAAAVIDLAVKDGVGHSTRLRAAPVLA